MTIAELNKKLNSKFPDDFFWRTITFQVFVLQTKQFVARVFNFLVPMNDEEIEDLTKFFRLIWKITERQTRLQAARLELARTLTAIKKRKIEIETQEHQEHQTAKITLEFYSGRLGKHLIYFLILVAQFEVWPGVTR